MSDAEQRAASQFHPIMEADAAVGYGGVVGVFRVAIDGTAQSFEIPDAWKGKWLDLRHSNSGELQYGFKIGGTAGGTVNMNEVSAITAPDVNAGYPIPVGSEKPGRIPNANTRIWLNFRCAVTGGQLIGFVSEQPCP